MKINDGSTPPKTKSVNNDSLRPIIYPDSPPNIRGNLTCQLTTVLMDYISFIDTE